MAVSRVLNDIIRSHFLCQSTDRAYYSEASVQLKTGFEIYRRLRVEPALEYKFKGRREYLDICFGYHRNQYGIELKYKTVEVDDFEYTTQSAQDHAKYDFLRDIQRLESFCQSGNIDIGYSVFVTNDKLYWTAARKGTKVKEFDLVDGTTIHGDYEPRWKGRSEKLNIKGTYRINWVSGQRTTIGASFKSCTVRICRQVS